MNNKNFYEEFCTDANNVHFHAKYKQITQQHESRQVKNVNLFIQFLLDAVST